MQEMDTARQVAVVPTAITGTFQSRHRVNQPAGLVAGRQRRAKRLCGRGSSASAASGRIVEEGRRPERVLSIEPAMSSSTRSERQCAGRTAVS